MDLQSSRVSENKTEEGPVYFHMFKSVFLVEKNKKSYHSCWYYHSFFELSFLFLVVEFTCLQVETKEEKKLAKTSYSLSHIKCDKYPIIFTAENHLLQIRRDLIEIFRHLCQYKGVKLLRTDVPDQVYMLVFDPPNFRFLISRDI